MFTNKWLTSHRLQLVANICAGNKKKKSTELTRLPFLLLQKNPTTEQL